ncbi:PREDICTED: actin-related protein 5 [Nicrophorus vespilloides]|uniref:Actin-related protein 5 n=1 Tax=Nicrophorus vespilloides TaxID=110193 RepID=A0ABM1M2Q6_NICVS|nr:PREDICTED: actin-related protein 5 [Nicrophorus vespilloides]
MDVIEFQDVKCVPDVVHTYTDDLNSIPIVIDNGSYYCRAGWSTSEEPLLIFKNLIAKPRKERSKKDTNEVIQAPPLQVGNDIINIEAVRFQLKTQFDRNVVTHFEAQEHLFDYTFSHLGIDTDKCIPHPIVMTEPYLNPNSSRQLMSELLFECYNVPSICYGIDSLFAYNFSQSEPSNDALIISMGYHTIHVIPIIDNETNFENTRRINTGGFHVISFLHRILQLKYPAHTNAITLSRAEELLHSICSIATDYREELKRWNDVDYYEKNIKKIQLPYSVASTSSTLTAEQQKERKKELARRLTEINARRRGERLAEDEEKLVKLQEIYELWEVHNDAEEFEYALGENGFESSDELEKSINLLKMRIKKTKQKILAANSAEELPEEPPNKQQKLNKIVFENEKAMHSYVQNAKKLRQDILSKKLSRKQKKQDMAKRRTAAGQERMRIISQLARKEKGNDDFGMRDEDWDIYKTISRDGGDSDSEAENEKLLELEEVIKTYDPTDDADSLAPAEAYQLHIGIEMYRAPELLFKPYMIGSGEAGLSEVIGYVLKLFSPEDQLKLAGNVIITGTLSQLPGLKKRILTDLISIRPFHSITNVTIMPNASLAPWHGAKAFSNTEICKNFSITKRDYEELGGDYLKHHIASNWYTPTPKEQLVEVDN